MDAKNIVSGDAINFDRLQLNLEKSVEKEDKYWRENDAKFRAVAQKVQSYEEFEDIVKAAHIQPMTEDITQLKLARSSWTTSGRAQERQKRKIAEASQKLADVVVAVPESVQDFTRTWRSLHTPPDRYKFLLDFGGKRFLKLLKLELEPILLVEVVHVLHSELGADAEEEERGGVSLVLRALARCDRFEMLLTFLSDEETATAAQLVSRVATRADKQEKDKLRRGWDAIASI